MILTIDQGQTKTVVLVLDENGEILGVGYAGGASHYKEGLEKASAMISAAAENALAAAERTHEDVTEVFGGIAGANWPEEIDMLEKELKRIFFTEKVTVVNDCVIALRAGTDRDDAIVLCTGSGMNSAVFVDGKLRLVYNNYINIYDQGSEGLGARAFEAAFQSYMHCGPQTILEKRLMDYFEIYNMDQLMLAFYRKQLSKPLKDVAELVFKEAAHNELVALDVIYEFGKSVSRYVVGAVERFEVNPAEFEVILTGGVFKNPNPLLYETVCSQIHRRYSNIKIKQSYYEPIIGAALMALDSRGSKSDDAHRLCKASAEKMGIIRRSAGE